MECNANRITKEDFKGTQTCSKCGTEHPLSHYIKLRNDRPQGYHIYKTCSTCRYASKKERNSTKSVLCTRTEKRCPQCNQNKPISEFARHVAQHDGLKCWCKSCENMKRWLLKFRPCGANEQHWQHYCNTSHCECCGVKMTSGSFRKTVTSRCQDHDHSSLQLRGVICNGCNLLEGYVSRGEDRALKLSEKRRIEMVKAYLHKWSLGQSKGKP
jgi:hypothetical protein